MPDKANCDHCSQPIEPSGGYSFFSSASVGIPGHQQLIGNMMLCQTCTDRIISTESWTKTPERQKQELNPSDVLEDPAAFLNAIKATNEASIVRNCRSHGLTPEAAKCKAREFALMWWQDPVKANSEAAAFWTRGSMNEADVEPRPVEMSAGDHQAQAIRNLTAVGGVVTSIRQPDGSSRSCVSFENSSASDDDLAALAQLPDVFAIYIWKGCRFTDRGMRHLAGLANLQRLVITTQLSGTEPAITAESLLGVSGDKLTSLIVNFDHSGQDWFIHLGGVPESETAKWTENISNHFPHLKDLTMVNCRFHDDSLSNLVALASLQQLSAMCGTINGSGLNSIATLQRLQLLNLTSTFIVGISDCRRESEAGFKQLAPLQNLRCLVLNGVKMSDCALDDVATLKPLRLLDISNNKELTNRGIERLEGLANLRVLGMQNIRLPKTGWLTNLLISMGFRSPRGIDYLQKRIPGLDIVLEDVIARMRQASDDLLKEDA